MNYAQIRKYDIGNGPGVRATLFVSGCTHDCKGCFNKEYQDFTFGKELDEATAKDFVDCVQEKIISGVNILGGEPLQQVKDDTLANLLSVIKEKTNKPIWLWTGYKIEDIANNRAVQAILNNVDILIDGRYEEDKKDFSLIYRGSSNQRVIDMNHFRATGIIKELENLTF